MGHAEIVSGTDELSAMRSMGGVPYVTAAEMAEADKSAIQEFGMDVLSLMENAGFATAGVARIILGGSAKGKKVCCLVGKGNNGGDGLVAARHLYNWGAEVSVVMAGTSTELRDVPARQFAVVERMGIPVLGRLEGTRPDLLVDALLGYGSSGDPRGAVAGLIREANESGVPILAVDLPSGFDATTGEPGAPCIEARATVTFGLPKTGFLRAGSERYVGDIYLADISLPKKLYLRFSSGGVFFGGEGPIRLRPQRGAEV